MALACPHHSYEEQCRRDAIASLIKIEAPVTGLVPLGAVQKQLRHLTATLTTARAEIEAIPEEWRSSVFGKIEPDDLARDLLMVRQASKELAEELKPQVRYSGGVKHSRENAARKRIAADCAFDLLNKWFGPEPTLTEGDVYFRLASLLFEIATGQKGKDLSRACLNHFAALEADDFYDAKKRQEIRRQAKYDKPPEWAREVKKEWAREVKKRTQQRKMNR